MEDLFGYEPPEPKIQPTYSKAFQEWWSYWIKLKRSLEKQRVYRIWKRLGGNGKNKLVFLNAMKLQFPYWKIREPNYRPYPATYLNNGRWEDSPEDILGRPLKKWEK